MGAAYATCIAFALMALLMYCINRYLIEFKLEVRNLTIIFLLLIFSYIAFIIYEDSSIVNFNNKCVFLCICYFLLQINKYEKFA